MRISDWSSDVCSSDLVDVRPVVVTGAVLPDAVTAIDRAIKLRTAGAVPEIQGQPGGVHQIDLVRDRGLDKGRAADGHGPKRKPIVVQRASIADNAVEADAEVATRCDSEIDRSVERQAATYADKVVQRRSEDDKSELQSIMR